jgi:phosphatidate phosphatase APP1
MKIFKPILKGVKKPFKLLKLYLKQKAGWLGTPKILAYRGLGNDQHVYINGMVIEDKGLEKPVDKQHVWTNILATIKRFSSDQIPGVKVEAKFLGMTSIAETDELGFFSFYFSVKDVSPNLLNRDWQTVEFVLLDEIVENQSSVTAEGEVRIVWPNEKRVIVSDIDDTVLVSHSTSTLRKLRLMLFKNALMRIPFKGVPSFYCALERGAEKDAFHPFFMYQAANGIFTICWRTSLIITGFPKVFLCSESWSIAFLNSGNQDKDRMNINMIKLNSCFSCLTSNALY